MDSTEHAHVLTQLDDLWRVVGKLSADNDTLRREVEELRAALTDEQQRRRVLSGRVDSIHRWAT